MKPEKERLRASHHIPVPPMRPLSNMEATTLSQLFYQPRTEYMNSYKLSKKAQFYSNMANIMEAQVLDWYWRQPINQIL